MYIICKNSVPESYANDYTSVEQFMTRVKESYSVPNGEYKGVVGKFTIVKEPINGSVYTMELIDNSTELSRGYVWNGTVLVTTTTQYTVYCVTKELRPIVNVKYDTVISELKDRLVLIPTQYEPLVPSNELSELRMLLDNAITSRRERINNSAEGCGTDDEGTEEYGTDNKRLYIQQLKCDSYTDTDTVSESDSVSESDTVSGTVSDSEFDSDSDSEFERWYEQQIVHNCN